MCKYYMKLLGFVILSLFSGIAQGGRWSRTGDLTHLRCGYSGVGLTNGKVMVMGTQYEISSGYEFFDPATGTWVWGDSLPPGSEGTIDHAMAVLLPNGKVIYLSAITSELWFYDPFTNTFFLSSASLNYKYCADATLLKNGQLLVMYDGQNCALYDYVTDGINLTGAVNYKHLNGAEVLLPDGKVLVTGGGNTPWGGLSDKCELYDAGSWSSADSMNEIRKTHVAMLFPPPWNKVLVAGGVENMDHPQKKECELYDIVLDTWAYTDSVKHPPRHYSTMALLPSGKAMIIGGVYIHSSPKNNNQCEIYDPETEKWSDTDSMEVARAHNTSFILPTGKVLTASGVETVELSYPEALTITAEIYDPSNGVWAGKPDLNVGRAAHTVTPLPIIPTSNCSANVLIAGGEDLSGALKSCELYNYCMERVTITDSLNEARTHHTAVLLPSGEVLVAGGKDGGALTSSELFNVPTQLWTIIGDMTNARFDHTATLLKNGDVLVTGGNAGIYLSSCEIYNSGNWTPTANPMATPRARHTAIILLNGNILVIGGQTTGGNATATCELWDGSSWTGFPSMSTARYWHTATLLQSGKVLVAGGTSDGSTPLSNCEIYDPDADTWTAETDLNQARYLHNTTLLYSGLVLVTGGNGGISSCETYDPATQGWTTDYTGTLIAGRAYHSSVLVPDTMPFILAIGGKSGASYLNSIEEYDVGLGYRSIWQSTITNYSSVTLISPSMDIEGTLFRGVSEADGGNYCHIANNDHPIISLVRIGGGNWQGNGGGEILHMPLSSYWDTAHTVVHPEIADFQGYYRLWSIVNGIPCRWYSPCMNIEEKTGERHKATGISVSVYPNPATTKTSIKFRVHDSRLTTHDSRLTIHDISGRLVRSLTITDNRTPNTEVTWDRRDLEGRKVKSGIYFYRLNYKDFEIKGKFIILK